MVNLEPVFDQAGHFVDQGLGIEDRGDLARHVSGHFELQGFARQLAGAQLDDVFHLVGVGVDLAPALLQPPDHGVERRAQLRDLALGAGRQPDTVLVVALADGTRALVQFGEGRQHGSHGALDQRFAHQRGQQKGQPPQHRPARQGRQDRGQRRLGQDEQLRLRQALGAPDDPLAFQAAIDTQGGFAIPRMLYRVELSRIALWRALQVRRRSEHRPRLVQQGRVAVRHLTHRASPQPGGVQLRDDRPRTAHR